MQYSKQDFQRLRNGMEMVIQTNRKDPSCPWNYRTFSTVGRILREQMAEIQAIMESMSPDERSDLYGTFYIKKGSKPEVRTFSKKIAESWGKTKEGKPKYREIQFIRNQDIKEWLSTLGSNLDRNFTMFYHHIHGFSEGKGTLSNVLYHTNNGRRPCHMINMDLENAFHQISDKNIKEFAEIVLGWNKKTAYDFANIMTYKKKMVQGNPASPVLLNIFALLMDFRIIKFCEKFPNLGLKYTRYGIYAWLHPDIKKARLKLSMQYSLNFGEMKFRSRRHYHFSKKNLVNHVQTKNNSIVTTQLKMF